MNTFLGIDAEEVIEIYPGNLSSTIQNVRDHASKQNSQQIQHIDSERSQQMEELDRLLCQLLWGQLQSVGLFAQKNPVMAELKIKTGFRTLYERWLEESISVLVRNNYLQYEGDSCTVMDTTPLDMNAVWKEWNLKKSVWLEDPDMKAQVSLVEATLGALPEILTGRVPATDIIFPNSSMDLVEGIYKNNRVADYFNEVLADTVVICVQEQLKLNPSAQIRILEIGAGTGGTSKTVFQKLKPYRDHIQEYCYTDISRAFLIHAEKEYGQENPYLTYEIFNVEEPIAGQNIMTDRYDIVIAANVLHATKNIRQTLRNAKAALRKNGLLLLNELSNNTLFAHLTFGLLDGWWLYEDPELRIPGCPGLAPQTWKAVLKGEGFGTAFFPAHEAHTLGAQIIVAESDGIVRKKQQVASSVKRIKENHGSTVPKKAPLKQEPQAKKTRGRMQDVIREKGTAYLKKVVGEMLNMPGSKIDSSEPLEKYGIDSILVVQLTNSLSKVFENISSTLFFEYQTIDALVEHFIKTQMDSLAALVGLDSQKPDRESQGEAEVTLETVSLHPKLTNRKPKHFMQFRGAESEITKLPPSVAGDIAIIGLSGRYPGANHVGEFWNKLKEGRNCITEIPKERWDWKEYFSEEKGKMGSIYTKWGGFIQDVDKFDPLFFQISPVEAERMDPQERQFLEVAYSSIEDAGYTPENLSDNRKIGVFVGVMNGNYPTGASYWSIANRISYLFNFQGPSMAVDTACSSSLTAIHLAVESLHSGMSECAIAGGVNLIVDPIHYMKLSASTMLSSGDRCKSFGDKADGFVDGEGVGAIVLKPLQKAVADGDHIYGIIKGSMINAGGKTNGYTVPNPDAQFRVISEALQKARVHARTISYLEAHGTGTALGDPIEVTGLKRAFEQDTKDKQFCAIGSVKSNIGHCESAAGIAGITKILLQLKYRQLVPSLHSETLNTNIDFSNTPFVVQQELTEWKQPMVELNGEVKEYPRIAGISSFGAGGSNAHVIIEEYIPQEQEQPHRAITPQAPAIIVLSAKNESRLKEHARQLLDEIQKRQFSDDSLADLAYTLQVGREAMEERLAMMAGSIEELKEKLKGFVDGQEEIEDLCRGQVKRNREAVAIFSVDEELQEAVDKWIQRKKYKKIMELWVKGLVFDWNKLYDDMRPHRVSLPTYPFSKESYWMPKTGTSFPGANPAASSLTGVIHPLLHQNTSNLSEQRFSSTFTGQEFFLADHLVNGQRVLPGVAYLEMARAAVDLAAGVLEDGHTGIRLKNVVWIRPVVVGNQPVKVHIGLYPEDNGEITYEIYSEPEVAGADPEIHSQGRAAISLLAEIPPLDIKGLQEQCSRNNLTSRQCYEAFQAMGIKYGPGQQGLETVYVGEGQVLAKISLPGSVWDTREQFGLHPSLMDSALQASIALMMGPGAVESGNKASLKPVLPFALQEIEVFSKCPPGVWALIRYNNGSQVGDKVPKFDVDIYDEQGKICVRMKGFSSRVLEGEFQTDSTVKEIPFESCIEPLAGTIMLAPVWDVVLKDLAEQPFPSPKDQIVIVGGTADNRNAVRKLYPYAEALEIQQGDTVNEIVEKIKGHGLIEHIVWIAPYRSLKSLADEAVSEEQHCGVLLAFRMIKALLSLGYEAKELGWTFITVQTQSVRKNDTANPTHASLHGLVGSLAKEYPNWKIRLVDLEAAGEWPFANIFALPPDAEGNPLAYRSGEWYRQQLIPVRSLRPEQTLYRTGGVYVVIGGAGGIGYAWSEYMVRTYQARIIWIGRREKDAMIQAKLEKLAAIGPEPHYITANATDRKALHLAYKEIKDRYSEINGVIHAAIVLLDQSLANMDEERFQAALSAKVDVSLRMVQVFDKEPLDFVMFFSSLQSFTKAPGQSNYASGCTFKDAFAHELAHQWSCPVKVMNWGYWGSVGIVASEAYKGRMAQAGIGSIEPPEAMEALETLLIGPMDQVVFMKTTKPLVMAGINAEERITMNPERISSNVQNMWKQINSRKMSALRYPGAGIHADSLLKKIRTALLQAASQTLRVKSEDMDADIALNEYGFDVNKLAELVNRLNQEYLLELTPTLLCEYSTLHNLAEYLAEECRDQFVKHFGIETSEAFENKEDTAVTGIQAEYIKAEGNQQGKELDELLCKLLWGQLQSIGWFAERKFVVPDLKIKTGLSDLYDRWLEESMAVLVRHKYLRYEGEAGYVVEANPIDMDEVWKEWNRKKSRWLEDSNMKAQVLLVEATMRALPEILTGKRLATDVMFPNSSMEIVEGIYKNNKIADYFNSVLADTVVVYIEERLRQDSSVQIRIIEIGAGTGGTSAEVLKRLHSYRNHIREYCYTDVSKAFLLHAEKEYGPKNPYLTYQIFNVEAPLAVQGIDAGGYDIVIAANVLHATKNIRQTLRNAKAALQKNGLLILNELSRNTLFLHLTFGLLEGWWLYEDRTLRMEGYPGLSPETWEGVLKGEGFQSVFFPAEEAHVLGQQIIVAESDGVVRQKQQLEPGVKAVKQAIKAERGQPYVSSMVPKPFTREEQIQKSNQERGNVSDGIVEAHVKETIIEKLSESLKVDITAIDIDESFADYGVDSITGVNLVQVINQALRIGLEVTSLFDYSSVNQLTAYILSQYKNEIAKALGQNVQQVDSSHSVATDSKENQIMYSYPKRFLRRGALPEPERKQKEESTGALVQKDAIAIIGMSGRFAKSNTVNELWEHLSKGTDLIEEVSRWDLSKHYPQDNNCCKHGSFLEDIDKFDPLFFNISGLEATYMDPQQRLFLEESWKALEDAGYAGSGIGGSRCGVYVGYVAGDYQHLFGDVLPAQAMWGNAGSVAPARIAYYLDLQGPAVAVDTACSSSLVAIHLACQGLWSGETEMALAGGVFVQSTPGFYLASNRAGMLSSTGRCHTFDEKADGFVPGEGVGAVVLKRLKEAIADGDHIYGVIRGSGMNQDGTTNGITAPSANSQERLERYVYDTFHIHPEEIQMVEAHGTGTKLGDPIEYQALTRAFRKYTDKKEYCAIGSIKTNIGHTQIAAGVAGLIKILLSLQHKQIPPSLHFEAGNSNIQFEGSPFYVNTRLKDWHVEPDSRCCALISSFGFSGTNAHMVIEEAPKVERRHSEKPGYLIVLSARTFEQLREQARQLVAYCEREFQADCGNISYTLLLGRKHFNYRLACVVRSIDELVRLLGKWLEKGKVSQIYFSELSEKERREQPVLKRFGNQCIENCKKESDNGEYLEHLPAVAELYVQGYELEFEQLFPENSYSRVPLPTYPFARERYWVPEAAKINRRTTEGDTNVPEEYQEIIPSLVESMDEEVLSILNHGNMTDNANGIKQYHEIIAELDRIGQCMLLTVLQKMGWQCIAGERYEKSQLRGKLGITPPYYRLYEALLDVLSRAGFIECNGEDIFIAKELAGETLQLELGNLEERKQHLVARLPEIGDYLRLLTVCLDAYPEILTGQKNHLEVMFPNGSLELVENIYKENVVTEYYNTILARMVKNYVSQRIKKDPQTRIKILEIGERTGGSSPAVLEAIKEYQQNVSYLYAGKSTELTHLAQQKYAGEYPFMEFTVLNMEDCPGKQGFEPDSIDLVLAGKVISATRRIDDTLNRLKKMLRRNGMLVINETTQLQEFAVITFGITSGWWNFEDEDHRIKGSPMLSSNKWRQKLEANGFRRVRIVDIAHIGVREPFQAIITAESDGRVIPEGNEAVKSPVEGNNIPNEAAEPRNALELKIITIWKEVLGLQQIGIHDHFQHLGGDSIMATQIISRLKNGFPFDLNLNNLFGTSTVAEMAEIIEQKLIEKIEELPEDVVKQLLA